jgi:hypothetical protein
VHISELEILFSSKRLQTYYQLLHGDKEKALAYYLLNMEISKSFYPLLSTVEIVLRNAIHNSCTAHFGTDRWLLESGIISINDRVEKVRKFRNRIFHYEPICNDLSALEKNHTALLDILSWLNKDLPNWLPQINRFQVLHQSAFELLHSR